MVEGSLWVYGHTRLTDYYRGDLSLRELANRLLALPPEAPICAVLREEQERAESARRSAALDDVMSRYKPRG